MADRLILSLIFLTIYGSERNCFFFTTGNVFLFHRPCFTSVNCYGDDQIVAEPDLGVARGILFCSRSFPSVFQMLLRQVNMAGAYDPRKMKFSIFLTT